MQVNVQQRRASGIDGVTKRNLDMFEIVKTVTAIDIDNQMGSRVPHAIAHDKEILAIIARRVTGRIRGRCDVVARALKSLCFGQSR